MKNLNSSNQSIEVFLKPVLVSEPSDFFRVFGEERLRTLAQTIPSHGHHQLESTTQGCISATIHATQEFLTQIVCSLSLTNPLATRGLVVSSSGLDAISWLKGTKDTQHGWIPTFPVSGFITRGEVPPNFDISPLDPAITLLVNRFDNEIDDFALKFSVTDDEDMRLLAMLIQESGSLWDEFEELFDISPSSSIGLPEDADTPLDIEDSCRDYATAFVNQVVTEADGDNWMEEFELNFAIKENTPLHEPIVAAISLFNAFSLYRASVVTMDRNNLHSMAVEELRSATKTGKMTRYCNDLGSN